MAASGKDPREAESTKQMSVDVVAIAAQSLKLYLNAIYHRCYRMLGEREMAQDATQEVFTLFYEARQRLEIKEPLHYLYRMSTNHCISLLKKQKRSLPLTKEVLDMMDSPNASNAESVLMVEALLQQFGEEAVALLAYRHLDKMTLKELGRLYGCSHQNIDKRLRRLHRSMQKYFAK